MSDSNLYINSVDQYGISSGFQTIVPTRQKMVVSSLSSRSGRDQEDSIFSVIPGVDTRAVYSHFAGIMRPDGRTPMINMNSFEELLEVVNLIVYFGDIGKAKDAIVKLALDPNSSIPWSLNTLIESELEYKKSIRLEFYNIKGQKRTDGGVCEKCGHDRVIAGSATTSRGLDEAMDEKVLTCANIKCGYRA